MIAPCQDDDDNARLFNVDVVSPKATQMEDTERRKIIKTVTNIFAFSAFFDAAVSFPLIVLLLGKDVFSEIAALISCMQITCFLFLSLITACLVLRTGNKFQERIDAIGAWVVVHFVSLIGNTSLVVFETYPEPTKMVDKSFLLIILVCWKIIFIILEVGSCVYCFYIVHKPVIYITEQSRPRHPLFEHNSPRDQPDASAPDVTPVDTISPVTEASTLTAPTAASYGSYLSLAQNTDAKYVRNPCYESELSLDYANNYSPYDDMMLANRNRLSYVERLPRVLPMESQVERNRPYLHNGSMSNRNSYISSHDDISADQSQQREYLPNTVHSNPHAAHL